jgi:hypothetical protein
MPDDALFLSELRKIRDETAELLEDANMWRFYDTAAKFRSRLAALNAAIARRIAPAEENPWKPLSDLPVPGREPVYVNVRTTVTSTYRWLPYRNGSQQLRQGIAGRWQSATDFGWDNATLPAAGEWTLNEPLRGQ